MRLLSFILLVLLTACAKSDPIEPQEAPNSETSEISNQPSSFRALQLENHGPAPELTNQVWLNTENPLRLADLRGQVVLLEMWTFG